MNRVYILCFQPNYDTSFSNPDSLQRVTVCVYFDSDNDSDGDGDA